MWMTEQDRDRELQTWELELDRELSRIFANRISPLGEEPIQISYIVGSVYIAESFEILPLDPPTCFCVGFRYIYSCIKEDFKEDSKGSSIGIVNDTCEAFFDTVVGPDGNLEVDDIKILTCIHESIQETSLVGV